MKLIKSLLLCSAMFISLLSCEENNTYKERLKNPQLFHNSMQQLSDVIVYDIFSPPVASRVYMYPSVASYMIVQKANPEKYNSLVGQLNGLTAIPEAPNKDVNNNLAALQAFFVVSKALIFSEEKLSALQEETFKNLSEA